MKLSILLFMLLSFFTTSSVFADTYIVKRGDTFSEIAYKLVDHNVYGVLGSLNKLKEWNPHINNVNKIFPGQRIHYGTYTVAKAMPVTKSRAPASVDNSFEVKPVLEMIAPSRDIATEEIDLEKDIPSTLFKDGEKTATTKPETDKLEASFDEKDQKQ